MRIIFVDRKLAIKEPTETFPTLVDAVATLDKLLSQGLALFGQVLANDGLILVNKAVASEPLTETGASA